MRYLSLLDADSIDVSDNNGASTAAIEGTDVRLSVPGVTQLPRRRSCRNGGARRLADADLHRLVRRRPTTRWSSSWPTGTKTPSMVHAGPMIDLRAAVTDVADRGRQRHGDAALRRRRRRARREAVVAPTTVLTGPDAADTDRPR